MTSNETKIILEAVEVGKFDENLAKENQYKFYKSLLDKDRIFVTQTFSSFNEKAKKNIKERLYWLELKKDKLN